jgi:hypothetical protein
MSDRLNNAAHPPAARGSTHGARSSDQVPGGPAANGRAESSLYSRLSPGGSGGGGGEKSTACRSGHRFVPRHQR